MTNSWTEVPLGELLTKSEDRIEIDPTNIYREITVRLWGKGVILRREATGSEIASSRRLRVRAGQLILSRIDARNGAFGLVPDSLDGAVVSNDFPVFTPNTSRLMPAFLDWMSKTRSFVEICKAASEGTTNRVRLQEERFLKMTIPLPPRAEQQRIVARIEELAAKIREVRSLRHHAAKEANRMVQSQADKIFSGIERKVPLGKQLFQVIYRYPTFYNITFTEQGIGLLKISNLTQEDWKIQFETPRDFIPPEVNARFPQTVLESGDLVMAARGATIGKTAYVTPDFAGFNINPNLLRLKPNASRLMGKYFWYFMRSGAGQSQFQQLVTSTAKETITLPKLKSILVPLPPLPDQCRIIAELDALQEQVDSLSKLQAQTVAELDSLMPSLLNKAFKGEL